MIDFNQILYFYDDGDYVNVCGPAFETLIGEDAQDFRRQRIGINQPINYLIVGDHLYINRDQIVSAEVTYTTTLTCRISFPYHQSIVFYGEVLDSVLRQLATWNASLTPNINWAQVIYLHNGEEKSTLVTIDSVGVFTIPPQCRQILRDCHDQHFYHIGRYHFNPKYVQLVSVTNKTPGRWLSATVKAGNELITLHDSQALYLTLARKQWPIQ